MSNPGIAERSRSGYLGLESHPLGCVCSSVQAKRNVLIAPWRFCHAAIISDFAGTGLLRSRCPSCSRSAGPCCASVTAAGKASAMMAALLIHGISPPQPLEGLRKRLLFHRAIDVQCVASEHKLVVV